MISLEENRVDYKTLMGYGKKKKVIKEQPKPKKNKILEL